MLANVDLIISGAVIVAVCAAQPWRTCCLDLLLFFTAIAVYALLSRQFKSKRSSRCSCKDSFAASEQEGVAECYQQETSYASIEQKESVECNCEEEAPTPISSETGPGCEKRGDENCPQPEPDCFVDRQMAEMKKFSSSRNIAGTMRGFRALQGSGVKMTSTMYNIVLRAWISCGNIQAAEDWMEDIKEAGMADLASFNTLIDALAMAHAFDKAYALLLEMREAEIQPDAVTFDHLLNSCARENRFHDGLSLMESMETARILPSTSTLDAVAKVLNGCRSYNESSSRVWQILRKLKLEPDSSDDWSGQGQPTCRVAGTLPVAVPRLVAVIAKASKTPGTLCQHEVQITGSLARVKEARRTLKQQGFLGKDDANSWPLNGHWETDHGLTVIIEGKVVRWSRQRASRLRFVGTSRRSCILSLYGTPAQGQLETPGLLPGSTKTLRWDNGDCWHSYDSRIIGQAAVSSQTMTKVLRDVMQDRASRTRSEAALSCVGKSGLGLPSTIESAVLQLLGHNLHCLRVVFDSKWNPRLIDSCEADADPIEAISRRNPRVGFRHCWTEPDKGCFGQRVLVNGEEVDEESFSRHVKIVSTM